MSKSHSQLVCILVSAAIAVLGAGRLEAKQYNTPPGVPSDSQALVNRVIANMSATNGEGDYGAFEGDCSELDVGANTEATRPEEQVIIADKIINIEGRCRMTRSHGGFEPKDSTEGGTPGEPPARNGR